MEIKRVIDKQGVTLFDMANIDKRDTKLPVNIWVDSSGSSRKTKHMLPRVKIQKQINNDNRVSNLVPVSISQNPAILKGTTDLTAKQLNEVFDFIKRNYVVFMKHWNDEITDRELLTSLK